MYVFIRIHSCSSFLLRTLRNAVYKAGLRRHAVQAKRIGIMAKKDTSNSAVTIQDKLPRSTAHAHRNEWMRTMTKVVSSNKEAN